MQMINLVSRFCVANLHVQLPYKYNIKMPHLLNIVVGPEVSIADIFYLKKDISRLSGEL